MASESEQQPPTTLVNKEDPITYQLALLKLKKQQAIQQPDTKKNKRVSRFKLILSEAGFSDKKLWDWLNLFSALAIPIIIFGATIWFSLLQFQLANQQNAQDQKLAEQQHVADQQHALDQQHAAIFQTYIDNIQDLLLNHHLRDATSNSEIAILARARTLTALQGLDSERKGRLVQFLYEAKLIGFVDSEVHIYASIINLHDADLKGAYLSYTHLSGANLNGVHLSGAYLSYTDLSYADLRDAYLIGTHFYGANLNYADLSGADLSGANLYNATLTEKQLMEASSLQGVTLPNGTIHP